MDELIERVVGGRGVLSRSSSQWNNLSNSESEVGALGGTADATQEPEVYTIGEYDHARCLECVLCDCDKRKRKRPRL